MRTFTLEVNGLDISEICSALTYTDYVNSVGRFDAKLIEPRNIVGFQTVKIYDDDKQVWQGRIKNPVLQNIPAGAGMPIGGLEWTDRLKDKITRYAVMNGVSITAALTEFLFNTPYGLGTVDDLDETESEVKVWDTQLEFLEFAFTDTCIVHGLTAEAESELTATKIDFCKPNLRCSFWYDGTTKRFYIIVYDSAATLLKYSFSSDGLTWSAWATFTGVSPAATEGANGEYSVAWHNDKVYLVCMDDQVNPDFDFWRGTINDGTGVITLAKIKDNIRGAEVDSLWAPIVFDSNDDVWVFYEDHGTSDYNARESGDDGATWSFLFGSAATTDVGKYAFRGKDDGDVIGIHYDTVNGDLEEWLWDSGGAAYAKVADINAAVATNVGYVSGFQDSFLNLYLVYEDMKGAGDADIEFSERKIDEDDAWTTTLKLVDDDQYQTVGNLMLGGDNAGNLYLFYYYDDDVDTELHILRRLEETWGTSTELATDVDVEGINCPEKNLAMFCVYKDTEEDAQFTLLTPYAIGATHEYANADTYHDMESGKDFDSEGVSSECTLEASTVNPSSGLGSIEAYTSARSSGGKSAYGIYESIGSYAEIWFRGYVKIPVTGIVAVSDRNEIFYLWCNDGNTLACSVAWAHDGAAMKWRLRINQGGTWTHHVGAVANPVVGTEYLVELYWLKDAAAGQAILYVDGVEHINVSGIDTLNGGGNTNVTTIWAGLYSQYLPTYSRAYIDDIAWGSRRIGGIEGDNFNTDDYTATASMAEWGSLESTDDFDNFTDWSVYDAVPTLLVSGLKTGVDLEDAGVLDTDDPISIRPVFEDPYGAGRIYVFDVRLSEKQGAIDVDVDYEQVSGAVKKTADMIGREYNLSWDDKLNFVIQRGKDKSDYIILKTAKSMSSYPEVPPNIIIVNREMDVDDFANAIFVKGAGDYPDRVEGTAQDTDSQDEYEVVVWKTLTNKDCITVGMCNTYARSEVNARKDPVERITVQFYDDYDAGDIEIGITVTIVDDETDLNTTARIVSLTYSWGLNGRMTTANLTSNPKSKTFIEYLAKVEDLERWV